ncbi:AAA family ATPase [candidate division WOR-1 bacterium RIFOXYB2_FULL_42_35]|uniref:AAA family ATPase n=1 Tax=candidate division WOR-1 bacterium RIFOXYC2_FULL_41_25 TaxID=1802586 RepID=A0A1F4TNS9_UNCSA|nr:MAG: AAA family ATPase [candidate division WOR-1 bacterium RIFOXYA2_FULL_41_14]OGC24812.1 MAG: AAA family ATPase [candidate division WOR-1 bacterium RIFOXYB2_FULL_42_35]OGC34371.1 MAG: AAA family ATPase [candidate division WOR-1 bacterium RIFOXYC2_FULL_41_25]
MKKRFLEKPLKSAAKKYPIVTLTGPRQSGKTTLAKTAFPKYRYVSLEDPDQRSFAEKDPRGFLEEYNQYVILDEVQRVPQLFSYLQTLVDEKKLPGQFVLTGSNQFTLNEKISQSLAGRAAIFKLLPFSLAELLARPPQSFWEKPAAPSQKIAPPKATLSRVIFEGLYPRIHDQKIDPRQWYRDYFETYVTKDVRNLLELGDLRSFEQFVRLLAGRSGQILNLTSLGNDLGVSHTTAKRWLSVLEASYLVALLPPYYKNFNKRIIKAPKVYFLDSGFLCFLLQIKNPKEWATHPQLGSIFETFIVSEIFKSFTHAGLTPPLYFWRDRSGTEIDLLIDHGGKGFPVEIKASQTINQDFLRPISSWLKLPNNKQTEGAIVFGGKNYQKRSKLQIVPWYAVS